MRKITRSPFNQYRSYLYSLLTDLDGILQPPKYHPESDALYHSLQVFELAYRQTHDAELWAAALFHDVGKAQNQPQHASLGAEMVSNILPQRVVWLVEHHLDLLNAPQKTQRIWAGTEQLRDLTLLRSWDLQGRSTTAAVMEPEDALALVMRGLPGNYT